MVPVSGRVRLLANRVKLVGLYKHVNLPLAQLDDDGTSCNYKPGAFTNVIPTGVQWKRS